MKPISKPGCYALDAEAYHADPCVKPSLSRSIAVTLLTSTPRRAFIQHPRLNPNFKPDQNKKIYDFGAVGHTLLLNDNAPIRVIQSIDYKSFAAQRARTEAYQNGQIPILKGDFARAKQMVAAARSQLCHHETAADAFLEGAPEQTLIWKEKIGGTVIWCRIRLDWLPPLGGWLNDAKTTNMAISPKRWVDRVLYPEWFDLQAAMYMRGYERVFGVRPAGFRFVVICTEEPFELFTVTLSNAALDMAGRDLDHAMETWAWCIKHKSWPGNEGRDYVAEASPWRERITLDREDREHAAAAAGEDLRQRMIDWQAPLDKNPSRGRKAA